MMNNTIKLALGITAFSSLLVLIVPANHNPKDKEQEYHEGSDEEYYTEEVASGPKPPYNKTKNIDNDDNDDIDDEDSYDEDSDNFVFGSPTVSPEPFDNLNETTNEQANNYTTPNTTSNEYNPVLDALDAEAEEYAR